MIEEAERRLREARERVKEVSTAVMAGRVGWGELNSAQHDLLVAERELARVSGGEYAVELDLGMAWDTGAPMPHVLANGHKTYVLFYLEDRDPDWDGTWARMVDPATPEPVPLGVVEFQVVHSIKLGGPNDEAIEGHPLTGKGLRPYAAHRVINSQWITAAEKINSVHPGHLGGWHDRLTHYVFCFHDNTLECLARGFTTQRYLASPRAVLSELVTGLAG